MSEKCYYCDKEATLLCDFPIVKGTCDRPVCKEHSARIAAGFMCGRDGCSSFTEDYCLSHAEESGHWPENQGD